MKKFTLFFTFLLLSLRLLATDCIPDCECETDWTLQVRGAYYQPNSKALRKVYTNHWLDYQVETAKRLDNFCEMWAGVCWASKRGHTRSAFNYEDHLFKDKTKIFVLPLSLGFKFIYPILPFIDVYVGGGVCYSFLKIRNCCKEYDSDRSFSHFHFKKAIYQNDVGAVIKLGFQWAMSDSTFLDFFADYYGQTFRLSHKDNHHNVFKHYVDCSGFKFGAGFGVYF
jgi:outer membrane protein